MQGLLQVIGEIPYKLTIRGSTVVGMESILALASGPKGDLVTKLGNERAEPLLKEELAPLYQREGYRTDKAPVRKLSRFVSSERVLW